jgi:hypothetical protein
MRILFLLFSFTFLFSAMNDCCLSEVEEVLTKISQNVDSDTEHPEEHDECEDCKCSTFCSYNIVSQKSLFEFSGPLSRKIVPLFYVKIAKEKTVPGNIFHPPIS